MQRTKELLGIFALGAFLGAGYYLAQGGGEDSVGAGRTAEQPIVGAPAHSTQGPEPASPAKTVRIAPHFVDRTLELGVDFVHQNGASGKRYFPETMGAGLTFLDYQGDGWADLLLVQSGPFPGFQGSPDPDSRLYRNEEGRGFKDVTAAAGLAGNGEGGYGMGAVAADVDNDGDLDLYLSRFGPDRFYRNLGNGTFEDATQEAGLGLGGWSESCCFFDYDRDGYVDLYVVRYCDYLEDHSNWKPCVIGGYRSYCSPLDYAPQRDVLYHNRGDGSFEDVTDRAGILDDPTGWGLGVIASDLDRDGWPDLYVANDLGENRLYRNTHDGRFEELGLLAGVALSESGRQQAGMGLIVGDVFRDGRPDLICTNYQDDVNNLYRNRSDSSGLFFTEEAETTGFGTAAFNFLCFGVGLIDIERDGRLDAMVAAGHIMDQVALWDETATFRQHMLLFHQETTEGGETRFRVAPAEGPFADERLWRGLVLADIDRDGDVDVAVSACAGRPAILVAEGTPRGDWLTLRLSGVQSNRAAIGARVRVDVAGDPVGFEQEVHAGSSYLAQSDLALMFGLGAVPGGKAAVEVFWPSGATQRFAEVVVNREYELREGQPALVEVTAR
ncbi:CRTAC1 family protein [Planctomycetota bacterium]